MLSLADRRWLCKLAAMMLRGVGDIVAAGLISGSAIRASATIAKDVKKLAELYDDPDAIDDLGYTPPKSAEE